MELKAFALIVFPINPSFNHKGVPLGNRHRLIKFTLDCFGVPQGSLQRVKMPSRLQRKRSPFGRKVENRKHAQLS